MDSFSSCWSLRFHDLRKGESGAGWPWWPHSVASSKFVWGTAGSSASGTRRCAAAWHGHLPLVHLDAEHIGTGQMARWAALPQCCRAGSLGYERWWTASCDDRAGDWKGGHGKKLCNSFGCDFSGHWESSMEIQCRHSGTNLVRKRLASTAGNSCDRFGDRTPMASGEHCPSNAFVSVDGRTSLGHRCQLLEPISCGRRVSSSYGERCG